MNRYTFTVQAGQGMPVRRFVRLALPTAPDWVLREAFKKRQVRVQDARVDGNHVLAPGDAVVIYTGWKRADLPVVYEDEQVLVCNKPANVISDRNALSPFSLVSWAEEFAAGSYQPILCHRLDNQTSGLILLSKSQAAADAVGVAMQDGEIGKQYLAIVTGTPDPAHADRTAFLIKDAVHARVRVVRSALPGARQIRTAYDTLGSGGGLSLLAITLHTGRTHQIRAHLAFLGHPVLGDDLYGNRAENRRYRANRLCLCACGLTMGIMRAPLAHLTGQEFRVDAPFSLDTFLKEDTHS